MNTLEQHIAFIKEAEGLKSVLRTSWSSAGRPESTAEHSWRLTLLAALFLKDFPTLDPRRTLLTALIPVSYTHLNSGPCFRNGRICLFVPECVALGTDYAANPGAGKPR